MKQKQETSLSKLVKTASQQYLQYTLLDQLSITHFKLEEMNKIDEFVKLKQQLGSQFDNVLFDLRCQGYQPIKYAGEGQFGKVIIIESTHLNTYRYAVKIISIYDESKKKIKDDLVQICEKEVELLKKSNGSDYVVRFQQAFRGSKFYYILMEECIGTLEQILSLSQNNKLNENSFLKYSQEIAKGLDHIHNQDIVLRDIKLDNILIGYDLKAKISDFGLAGQIKNEQDCLLSSAKGNSRFSSPEANLDILQNSFLEKIKKKGQNTKQKSLPIQKQSKQSDIYSLGMLFMYILGYQNTFNIVEKLYGENDNEIPDLNQFKSKDLIAKLLLQMTEYLPLDRISTQEVLKILGSIKFDLSSLRINDLINPSFNNIDFLQYIEVGDNKILTQPAEKVIENLCVFKQNIISRNIIEQRINYTLTQYGFKDNAFNDINQQDRTVDQFNNQIQEQLQQLKDLVNESLNKNQRNKAIEQQLVTQQIENYLNQFYENKNSYFQLANNPIIQEPIYDERQFVAKIKLLISRAFLNNAFKLGQLQKRKQIKFINQAEAKKQTNFIQVLEKLQQSFNSQILSLIKHAYI